MPNDYDSMYCYEGTNILINNKNIKDFQKLETFEKSIVAIKLMALNKKGITGNFDTTHFLAIHKFLFEDIYPFAGKFRKINISKGYFQFAQWEYIEPQLKSLLNQLKSENYLQGLNVQDFSKKLAFYWSEFNVLHPFREGNRKSYTRIFKTIISKQWIYFKFKERFCFYFIGCQY